MATAKRGWTLGLSELEKRLDRSVAACTQRASNGDMCFAPSLLIFGDQSEFAVTLAEANDERGKAYC